MALAIVEDLYVFEDRSLCLGARFEALLVDQLLFQGGKETFHWSVIQAFAGSAH
ncbi:hypothetical protein L0Z65_02505 [Phaeobacter sp. BS52]